MTIKEKLVSVGKKLGDILLSPVKLVFAIFGTSVRKKHFKAACDRADQLRLRTFKKQLVVLHRGEFIVVSKQRLKAMYQNGEFKKGLNFRDIENAALYSTP